MRRLCAFAFILSLAGLVVSTILLVMHYSPESAPSWIPFSAPNSPCSVLARSNYSQVFGVPLASISIIFYLWISVLTGMLFVSGYIRSVFVFLMLAVSSFAFGLNVVFGVVLIVTRSFCPLCVVMYFINMILLLVFIIMAREEKRRDTKIVAKVCRTFLSCFSDPFERFGYVLFGTLTFFIVATVSFATISLSLYRDQRFSHLDLLRGMVENFAAQSVVLKNYPVTPLVKGTVDAKVKIAVFTDPFCPPCLEYSALEEKLREKYGPNVVFYHYLFPLDKKCNSSSKRSPHPYACEGSGYMLASAKMGLYDSFVKLQRTNLASLTKLYAQKSGARTIFKTMFPGSADADADRFESIASSKEVSDLVARDVLYAQSISIKHTPTIFIGGKEVKDQLSFEFLDALVADELRNVSRKP